MAKEIWNEGRVVGYSAYDIYVKQHLASQPDGTPPASESEWLSASLASGNSLLAKIPNVNDAGITDSTHSYIDFILPADSRLGAANTIVASFFDGDANFPSNISVNKNITYSINGNTPISAPIWADKVIDYGELIQNDNSASPSADGSIIPVKQLQNWPKTKKDRLIDYMKIVDGVVIQPGEWSNTESGSPKKDEFQDLSGRPFIRLHILGKISNNPIVLFTGFTIRSVLSGTSILGSATNTELREDETGYLGHVAPEDGDFLGPSLYPWANKIVFSVPSSFIAYFESEKYERNLPTTSTQKVIADTPTIDMNKGDNNTPNKDNSNNSTAIDPYWFYDPANTLSNNLELPSGYKNSVVPYNVVDYSTLGDGTAVLTVFEKRAIFPPALYGTFVDSTGTNHLSPLDCVAPGTMKMFIGDSDGSTMKAYEDTYPGTVALDKDPNTGEISTLITIDGERTRRPVAQVKTESFGNSLATVVKVGNKTVKSLAVSPLGENDADPTKYSTDGSNGNIQPANGKFHWNNLTNALKNNKFIDILKNGLTGGTGINISGTGPYTISYIDGSDSGINAPKYVVTGGSGINVFPEYNPSTKTTTFTVVNTLPYNPGGVTYHYIKASSSSLDVRLRSNFCGAKSNYSIGTASDGSINYKNFVDASTYVNKIVRVGVNMDSMGKDPNTGLYSGVMYFKIDFSGTWSGDITAHLGNKNMSNTSDSATTFMFSHSNSTLKRRQRSSIISVKFKGTNWGNLSNVSTAHWNATRESLWNLYEVYKYNGSFHVFNPGGSFFPAMTMWAPQHSSNPYSGYFTLHASGYYDGYNAQLDKWEGRNSKGVSGHIFSPWLNMNVEWACRVTGVNKAAILAL